MRKNLGPKPYLYPCPVLILGSYDENGKPNAMNAAWGGIVGAKEIAISLGKHKTTENILLNKAFTVSFADAAHVVACDYVGIDSMSKVPDKMEKAGFTTVKSEFVNAPIINELPLALECTLKEVLPDGIYIGEIVNISADESILTDGEVDLEKFFPIIIDPAGHGYYKYGEKAGNAFSDGRKLQ
ncbi:MAG: flavin reductase family protein [Firmicutes bacterium]|nr:flavin reductase family protein [[Eubacterium] siraeum]MCM1488749.1 flavin reductase family protein [Bacillota bacterium]